jgi:hypothetical protein
VPQISGNQLDQFVTSSDFSTSFRFWYHSFHIQVTVDVYLIESDQIANAIIELVPVLHIKQLVLGVSKSNVR